jgi:hypothetical protein
MKKVQEWELNEFYKRVSIAMSRFPDLRHGQAIFNEAVSMWPDEVEKIRGTEDDCFYDDKKIKAFLSHFEIEM